MADTTPAPMTHEEVIAAIRDTHVTAEQVERACAYIEAERTRADALAAEVAKLSETWTDERGTTWRPPTAWAYARLCRVRDERDARIAELEAVVGRCERLATTFKLIRGDELRTALRGQRADTGRGEG